MNVVNFKNPEHQRILREEILRVKRILTEGYHYSEDEIWEKMSDDERWEAIASVRDDEGPDDADRYADEKWDNIPDSLTDQMNLNDFQLAKYDQGGRSMLRGIDNALKQNPDSKKFVDKFLQKVGRKDLQSITVKQAYQLNPGLWSYINSKKPSTGTYTPSVNTDFNPYEMPGGRPSRGYMGAKWTGD